MSKLQLAVNQSSIFVALKQTFNTLHTYPEDLKVSYGHSLVGSVKHPQKTGYFCIKHLVSWTKKCNLFIEYKFYLTFSSFLSKWDGLVYFYFPLWILVLCICNKQNSLWCKMPSAIAKQLYIFCSQEIILGPWYIVRFSSLSCVIFYHPRVSEFPKPLFSYTNIYNWKHNWKQFKLLLWQVFMYY